MQARARLLPNRALTFIAASALLLVACAPATGEDPGPGASAAGIVADAAATDGPANAGYFHCERDCDCVAVRRLSDCCDNGWKIAVAQTEMAAYLEATACPPLPRHICPEYFVLDTRVPACDLSTATCVLVPPGDGEHDGGD